MKKAKSSILHEGNISYVVPFILITSCFALWGFANDITNPMVKAFSKIFRMSVTEGTLVQVAFYGGYFAMAFPAAMQASCWDWDCMPSGLSCSIPPCCRGCTSRSSSPTSS